MFKKEDDYNFYKMISDRGIYYGPEVCPETLDLISDTNCVDLGKLRVVQGGVHLEDSSVKSLGKLVEIYGDLDLSWSDVTNVSSLKIVTDEIRLFNQGRKAIRCFQNLEFAGLIITINFIPYLPNLRFDVEIDCRVDGVRTDGINRYYRSYVQEILDTPTTDLIPLRNQKEYLEPLIDARLRGELKLNY